MEVEGDGGRVEGGEGGGPTRNLSFSPFLLPKKAFFLFTKARPFENADPCDDSHVKRIGGVHETYCERRGEAGRAWR